MQFGILTTNGGTHTPEKWASHCAGRIVAIGPDLDGVKLIQAQTLQAQIAAALVEHHAAVRDGTKAALASDPAAHFAQPELHDPGERLDAALAAVVGAAKGTPWEGDFADPEKVAMIRHAIGQSFVDVAHVERLHHSDRRLDDAAAQAYRAQFHGPRT
jgi:hypothetical protein